MVIIPQRMFAGVNNYILLCIPFFMLAGELMGLTPLYGKLINLSKALVGHIRGGLSHVNIVVSMFFAGMTGNQHADQLLHMWRDANYADLTLTDIDEMFSKHMSAHKRGKMLDRLERDGLISKRQQQRPNGGRPATIITFNGLTDTTAPTTTW